MDDLGMDWALGARRYEFHLGRSRVYAQVNRYEGPQELLIDCHQGVEFGVLLSGRVERHWTSFSRECEAGDIWMASMWEPHGYCHPTPDMRSVVAIFLPEFLGDFALGDVPWLSLFAAPPDRRPQVLTAAQRARVMARAGQMASEIEERPPGWTTALKLGVLDILFDLSRTWNAPGPSRSGGDAHTSLARVMPALDLIRDRGSSLVGVGEAAKACGMSRTTLNRLFRQATGISFGRFRRSAHLAHAAHLLLTTDLSTDRIAEDAGFSDGSHLHRSFLKHYGRTPGEYRVAVRARAQQTI